MVEIKSDADPGAIAVATENQAGESRASAETASPGLPPTTHPPAHRLDIGNRTGIDSEAITQSSIADPDELAAPPVDSGTAFQAGQTPLDRPLDGPASDLPADPSAVWQSESSRRTSQLALVAMLALFGLAAATIGFIQFARSFTRNQVVAQNDDQPSSEMHDGQSSQPLPDESGDLTGEAAIGGKPDGDVASGEPPLDQRSEIPSTDWQPSAMNAANANTKPAPNDAVIPDFPAFDFDTTLPEKPLEPADMPATGPAIAVPPVGDQVASGMDDLPIGLRKFVPLLDISTADNGAPQVFATPPTIDSVQLDAAAEMETDETPTVKRASIDVPKLLALRFAIDNRGASLSEMTLLASQLTGVPIELELISLDLAGVSIDQPIQTAAGWMSMDQWLQQTADSAGLAIEVGEAGVLVHASLQRLAEVADVALVLDDFGDDAQQVAAWLKPVVTPPVGSADEEAEQPNGPVAVKADPAKPWTFDPDAKRLLVPADRYLLVQSICAVEALRLVRGKPTKLPRKQTARWIGRWTPAKQPSQDSSSITDWPLVRDGTAGAQLDSPRTMAGLLRRVATENRVAAAVVWHDVIRHQVYPTDLAMPLSDGLTAGDYLDELIGEAGLQARQCGDSIWWIASEGLYDRYEVITWMNIPADSGAAIAKRIAVTLGVQDPETLPIAWDQSTLMIRAPRYIARQLQRFITP
jgi:hypothetical protein